MKLGKACAVFMQIESSEYTDEEKAESIYHVMSMPTHNGINKDSMLKVIKWLFDRQWEVEDGAE